MRKRDIKNTTTAGALTTNELCAFLSMGRSGAVSFGEAAGARIQIGRCVRWNKAAVQRALDSGLSVASTAKGASA
jgi:predicted DNA-binding transcriptional regulator AlpA